MSKFKIGQKVVCVKSHSKRAVVSGKIYTVTHLIDSLCNCGPLVVVDGIEDAKLLKNENPTVRCFACGRKQNRPTGTIRLHFMWPNLFAPLSYTSNTNLEIISLFAPTEERADLTPEPKKETA